MRTMRNMISFQYVIELIDSGGNGNPDADNAPRTDNETGQAITTDVWLKRRIRDYVGLTQEGAAGHDIYIKDRTILANTKALAYAALGITPVESVEPEAEAGTIGDPDASPATPARRRGAAAKTPKASDYDNVRQAGNWMCGNYWDIATFGGVLSSKGPDCGQIRGPIQLTFGRSVDPVLVQRHTIDRIAVETVQEAEKMGGRNHTMGSKYTIPYALIVGRGYVSPHLFAATNFTEAHLQLFWKALWNCWELDRSASRGTVSTRRILAFEHDSPYGSARAADIFDCVKIARKDPSRVARAFSDYAIEIGELPKGVKLIEV